jgi:hypothetical protein
MMGETIDQFSLSRAALSTGGRAQNQILISISLSVISYNPTNTMKTKLMLRTPALAALLLATLLHQPSTALAQGTAFTYQGRLTEGGQPASGLYDFRAQVYNRAVAGEPGDALVSTTLTFSVIPVTNGLFVLNLDFGATPFNGEARWLLLAVRTNNALNYSTLTPRQPVTPAPYAISAGNLSGTLPAGQLGGNLNAATLPSGGNWALNSTLTLDSSTLAVDPINNRVGIGTSTPATPLTVATGSYGIEHTDGTRRLSTYLDDSGCWLGSVSADKLSFYVNNGGSALTIDLVGRVGIGTASPTHQLTVVSAETNALRVMTPATGDNTVILPADSISALETSQEPGLAHRRLTNNIIQMTNSTLWTSWTPILTNTINCPGAGFVMATFTAEVSVQRVGVFFDIAQTNIGNVFGYGLHQVSSFTNSISSVATIHRVFSVTGPGAQSFQVLGHRNSTASVIADVTNPLLTLLYVPTAYGNVDP